LDNIIPHDEVGFGSDANDAPCERMFILNKMKCLRRKLTMRISKHSGIQHMQYMLIINPIPLKAAFLMSIMNICRNKCNKNFMRIKWREGMLNLVSLLFFFKKDIQYPVFTWLLMLGGY